MFTPLRLTCTEQSISSPETNVVDKDLFRKSEGNMPASNRLAFLRPLYDIAVWQFILMLGFVGEKRRNRPTRKLKFTWKMHEVVANFVCKLLDTRPFDHLKARMEEEEVKMATEDWKPGDEPTKKLIEWCQDQWRRKDPEYPKDDCAFATNEPCTMPWFDDIPTCFNCGVPCPECRSELGVDIPMEMSTARAVLDFDKIHAGLDDESRSEECVASAANAASQVTSRMTLRSSRKK